MDIINHVIAYAAMAPPLLAFGLLFARVRKNQTSDWKLAVCLCSMGVAVSLILLLAAEKVSVLKYGDIALEVNQKADEIRKLTDQNKQIAKLTAKAIVTSANHVLADESYDVGATRKALGELLKAAGATAKEIDDELGVTNSAVKSQ